MRHINLFSGPQIGGFGWVQKVYVEKVHVLLLCHAILAFVPCLKCVFAAGLPRNQTGIGTGNVWAKSWHQNRTRKNHFPGTKGVLGNGRSTVSRVLFRRRELTEPHWVLRQTQWVLRKTRWVRFGTQIIGWEELAEFSPGSRWGPKNSLSSVFETMLFETVFGPFPRFTEDGK